MSKKSEEPEFSEGPPPLEQLRELYASLHWPRDSKELTERFGTPDNQLPNAVVCKYLHNGILVAVLCASKDGNSGTVLDVAVHPDYQRSRYLEGLIRELKERHPKINWRGKTSDLAVTLNRDLSIVQTLYGISLAFGFQKLVEATYSVFDQLGSPPRALHFIFLFLALVISLLGIRFYWCVNNIRRFVLRRIYNLQPFSRRNIIVFDLPVLFMHAVFFFFLCRICRTITETTSPPLTELQFYQSLDKHLFPFVGIYWLLLVLNTAWLARLTRHSDAKWPENFWKWNNLVTALVTGIAALNLWLCFSHHYSSRGALLAFLILFLINSVLDLYYIRDYLLGDHL